MTQRREILQAQGILNAGGRSCGVVLVVPGKVVGIDLKEPTIGAHWTDLRETFGQSDQCLDIDDLTCPGLFGPMKLEKMASGTEEVMKKSRFSEKQVVKILRETDTSPVTQAAKKHGVSEQTIYGWRKRFGKLEAVDAKRLRQLEQENAKLKKVAAERDLEIDVMKEVARKQW